MEKLKKTWDVRLNEPHSGPAEGRFVKLADSADNNNLSRIEAVNVLREAPFDQASNMATRAALELNPEEETWFEASISKVIN